MNRELAKKKAQSRDCHCVKGKDRDNNYDAAIDEIFDWHENEVKNLTTHDVSGSLPVYATTFDDKGELEHQRFSVGYAGEVITELSKKVNEFETFIDNFNENYR
jgi:hypothetical protein